MVYTWELEKLKSWDTNKIKNAIWLHVDCGQPIPGQLSLQSLQMELRLRGESEKGFHNNKFQDM